MLDLGWCVASSFRKSCGLDARNPTFVYFLDISNATSLTLTQLERSYRSFCATHYRAMYESVFAPCAGQPQRGLPLCCTRLSHKLVHLVVPRVWGGG